MSSVFVEYVGLKPSETDHLYGTGIVWTGRGDVKEVPADAWHGMKKHADVWREVPRPAQIPAPAEVAGAAAPAPEIAPPASPAEKPKAKTWKR